MATERITGMRQLRAAFKALPDVAREALADATEETAIQIRAAAVRTVSVRHGFLRDAIEMSMSRRTGVARVGITRSTRTTPDGEIVDPAQYAHFVEFGTIYQDARPFILPAAEGQREAYLARAKGSGRAIEKNMAAIGGRFA